MIAVVDVQLRIRDEQLHQPGVGQRDVRVVIPGHDERRLAQPRQERHAGPARAGGELVPVAAVQVSLRRHHPREHGRPGRHHQAAGGRRHQDEPAAPVRLEAGEVLRDGAAPGDSEHVHAVVAELGQHPRDELAEPAVPVRAGRGVRAADAWRVKPDYLGGRIELVHERREHLEAGADAVDQQQRHPPDPARRGKTGPDRDPQRLPPDRDAGHLSGHGHSPGG